MKQKKLITVLLLCLIFPNIVYADCTKEELKEFRDIEEDYKVTYEFDSETKTYMIYFTNPSPKEYGYKLIYYEKSDSFLTTDFTKLEEEYLRQTNLSPGEYTVEIYKKSETCQNKLKTINLKLSKPNPYYNDKQCEGIEEFVLCQETYDRDIDYETFTSRINTYKKSLEKKQQDNQEEMQEEKNEIIEYITNNMFYIILFIIFAFAIIMSIVTIAKIFIKRRRLE